MCAKFRGLISQKRRGHVDLCAVNVQKLRPLIVIGFSVDSIFGVTDDSILVLRNQFFEY